jgi:hypothetical protein
MQVTLNIDLTTHNQHAIFVALLYSQYPCEQHKSATEKRPLNLTMQLQRLSYEIEL